MAALSTLAADKEKEVRDTATKALEEIRGDDDPLVHQPFDLGWHYLAAGGVGQFRGIVRVVREELKVDEKTRRGKVKALRRPAADQD